MKRLIFGLLAFFALQANAETIVVQSGDHAGFSRLVLPIPAERQWRLGRHADGYKFDTGDPADSLDVSRVFDLITRNRISALAVDATNGVLILTLACTCHATAFRWQENWVIIDIVDGPAAAGSRFEEAFETGPPENQNAVIAEMTTMDAFLLSQAPLQLSEFRLDQQRPDASEPASTLVLPLVMDGDSAVIMPATLPETALTEADQSSAMPGEEVITQHISATEQAVIESFARAASQGLLNISVAPPPPHVQEDSDEHNTGNLNPPEDPHTLGALTEPLADLARADGNPLAAFELQAIGPEQPGVSSRTSIDLITPPEVAQVPGDSVEIGCLDDALFNMDEWGDERDFSTQISDRLSGLTTEFDVYPEGAVENLARSYLYFGFGREALQALELDGIDSQQRRVLQAIAYITDEESDPSGLLSSQSGCASQVAFWAVLSRGSLADTTEEVRVAATEGFRALPEMLRGHLGVRLAELFDDFGDPEAAETILRAAEGHVTADRAETDVVAAEIMLATQGAEAAIPALEEIAAADIRLTPEALIDLIDLTLGEGLPLDPGLISLAESMVYEHRNQPLGAMLISAQARALTAGGAYLQALSLLDGDVAPMESAELALLRANAIRALTETADDASFLNFAFDALPETGIASVENVVADRLLALGFADRAEAVLTSPATGADARDRLYLKAEIAIALGDFAAVDGILAGMTDPLALELRAVSLTSQGEFAAAAAALNVLPGTVLEPQEAWRAGEWLALEQSDDALLQAASDAVLAAPQIPDPTTPLAEGRALIEEATATRDLTGQLLDRFAVEPAAETVVTQ